MKITRLDAIGIMAATASFEPQVVAQQAGGVSVGSLGGAGSGVETGVSWGVAWARGMVGRTQTFALTANDGKSLPLQAWPLAWWPEGSIKFSGFATGHGGWRVPVAICFASQNERHSVLAWWLTGKTNSVVSGKSVDI